MKITLAIVGGLVILAAPLSWYFLHVPGGLAFVMAVIGWFIIPDASDA
jgi:hypothetical protein